ncbi:MAG: flagellar motor protein MotD [Sedimenticola sp.]
MARKRREEQQENHERWLVSYADFITLLFAFFVVMYSISSVNDGKYRVLSNTLTDAFQTKPQSPDLIQVGEDMRSIAPIEGEFASPTEVELPAVEEKAEVAEESDPEADEPYTAPPMILPEIESALNSSLSKFVDQDLVNVTQTDKGIEVEMKSKMLFGLGSANLSREALNALRDVAKIVKPLPNRIHVEGHTDNLPIRTIIFPSNWELSAARAASVVHFFGRLGVEPSRMAAIGYGQFQPLTDNATEQGKQKNRRVAIIIMAAPNERANWASGGLR